MPRQRMIQPGIWTDEGFLELSLPARLLFIGIISGADDEGRGLATDRCLKARIFPADKIDLEQVIEYRNELVTHVNVKIYEADGKEYYELSKWHDHQRLERPSKSIIPAPTDDSGIDTGMIPDDSGTTPAELKRLKKEEKEKKVKYADEVTLKPEEYQKLVDKYGEKTAKAAIEKLSESKMANGYKYKSDYHAILNWVIDALSKKGIKPEKKEMDISWTCGGCGARYRSTAASCRACGAERSVV